MAKIVGFEVAPVTAQSAISAAKAPLSSSSRESVSSQIETPASCSCLEAVHAALPSRDGGEFLERHVGVGEAPVVDGDALADEALDRVGDVPDVDVHAGHDAIAGEPEGDELAARGIAAEDDAVPVAGEARVLHADVVLVGEEVRQAVVGVGAAEHVAGGGRPLVERVGPVLDADPLAVEGVVGVGDVAGGEHAGRAGLQVLVDEDAVVDGEPGLRGELGARLHADADDHEVALELASVAGADALDRRRRPRRPRRRSPCSISHAVVGVDVAVDGADLGAEHALERDRERVDDGDLEAALAGRGGDLGADPAGADHDDRAAAVQPLAQRVGVATLRR